MFLPEGLVDVLRVELADFLGYPSLALGEDDGSGVVQLAQLQQRVFGLRRQIHLTGVVQLQQRRRQPLFSVPTPPLGVFQRQNVVVVDGVEARGRLTVFGLDVGELGASGFVLAEKLLEFLPGDFVFRDVFNVFRVLLVDCGKRKKKKKRTFSSILKMLEMSKYCYLDATASMSSSVSKM